MKKIISLLLLLLLTWALAACSTYTYDNASSYRAASGTLSLEQDAVNALDVDWSAGSVTIETWEEDTISVSETAQVSLSTGDKLRYHLDNKTLRIRYMQESVLSADLIQKNLIIKLPKSLTLTELELNTDSASVQVQGINCTRYELESISGKVAVTATTAVQVLEIDTVSGACDLSFDALSHFEIDTISGGVRMTCQAAPSDGEISSMSGDVELVLPEDSDFTIEYQTTSGKLTSDLPLTVTDKRYVYGTGAARYQLELVSANIHIKKFEKAS